MQLKFSGKNLNQFRKRNKKKKKNGKTVWTWKIVSTVIVQQHWTRYHSHRSSFGNQFNFRSDLFVKPELTDGIGSANIYSHPAPSSWTEHLPLLGGNLYILFWCLLVDPIQQIIVVYFNIIMLYPVSTCVLYSSSFSSLSLSLFHSYYHGL